MKCRHVRSETVEAEPDIHEWASKTQLEAGEQAPQTHLASLMRAAAQPALVTIPMSCARTPTSSLYLISSFTRLCGSALSFFLQRAQSTVELLPRRPAQKWFVHSPVLLFFILCGTSRPGIRQQAIPVRYAWMHLDGVFLPCRKENGKERNSWADQ